MINRRNMLLATAAVFGTAQLTAPRQTFAQDSVFDRFSLFVPSGVGGGWDGVARAIDQVGRKAGLLSQVTIDNVPGAGGTVGLPLFINQHRGRDSSLMIAGNVMMAAIITNKTPYGLQDVTPVARLTQEASVIAVGASSPYQTIDDLVDALKKNPGLPIGGGSAGGIDHIILGLTLKAIGADVTKANYVAFSEKAQAMASMMENQVHAALSGYSEYAEQIRAGNLRALATTGELPLEGAGVPTLKQIGIDVALTSWRGVFAPPEVSEEQVARLVGLITAVHDQPDWKQILKDRQWDDAFATGPDLKAAIANDRAAIQTALKAIGLA
ncbi:tripartite tricarboxylate transporter substrate binding protein [Mesorhizobium sp. CGMCC 1.15528]|uniref:Tripartite tricarboxylate transporter substrate binding protein n=1 Tax=Mesorhizobium zhangyense TaxID=1776730 RepID=A0A7C9RBQ9_9HYPH|nr:tripartite tricarboxylate transporter substrate-binding protein [Mesorhizobium zhangyense]NGN45160.1 tripartite tricarboxylate transporter substrate binding protein [Mesorhizobium zhangyense]